ncbi:sensor histidine kinase YesM [Spirochaetia bacterium]|nr:sensor histidine kinase YesM [Spirochaetia bacterium]
MNSNTVSGQRNLRSFLIKTSYIPVLLSIVLISGISIALLFSNARKYVVAASRQETQWMAMNGDNIMERLQAFVNGFSYVPDFQRLLQRYNRGEIADINTMWLAMNRFWVAYENSLGSEINNAAVFALNGDMVGSLLGFTYHRNATEYGWFESLENSGGETLWLDSIIDSSNRRGGRYTITALKKIRAIGSDIGSDLGYLLIYIDSEKLLENIAGSYRRPGCDIFITDQEGIVLAHQDREMIGKRPLDETYRGGAELRFNWRQYIYNSALISRPGWNIICLTDMAFLLKDASLVAFICIFAAVLVLCAFFIIFYKIAGIITKPIRILRESFSILEQGNFNAAAPGRTGITEIDDLNEHFNVMVQRLENLIYQNYESKLREQTLVSEMKEIEIKALQLQMNPHFLYNTLDSINWMALSAGNGEISRIVLALGNFFRSNMSSSEVFTTLGRDVENVRYFLLIQKVRFDDKLDYSFEIEEGLSECQTLRFLLQPLVENSIKHGIDPCDHSCAVVVSAYRAGEELCIDVRDNGCGMDGEALKSIRDQWEHIEELEPGEDRVGLINIMKRLNLCYQDQARFTLESGAGQGTVVQIRLPFLRFFPTDEKNRKNMKIPAL